MAALCVDPSDSKLTRYAHDENRAYKEKTPQVKDLRGLSWRKRTFPKKSDPKTPKGEK